MSTTLTDLRRLNIEQQRAEKTAPEPEATETTGPAPISSEDAQASNRADAVMLDQADDPETSPADAHMRNRADDHLRTQALAAASAQLSDGALDHVIDRSSAPLRDHALEIDDATELVLPLPHDIQSDTTNARSEPPTKPIPTTARRHSANAARTQRASPDSTDLVATIRERIRQNRRHPGGTKPSVDMDPDLLLRARRYCLDNGNPPLRNVIIELLSAFLEEEGY